VRYRAAETFWGKGDGLVWIQNRPIRAHPGASSRIRPT
jgi:hypothetical protein